MPDTVVQQNITLHEGSKLVTVLAHQKHLQRYPHIRIFTETWLDLTIEGGLNLTDWKVLNVVLTNMEYENRFCMSQKDIGAVLGLEQSQVSRSLKRLVSLEAMMVTGSIGRQNIYMVSPYLALKSRSRNRDRLAFQWEGYKHREAVKEE